MLKRLLLFAVLLLPLVWAPGAQAQDTINALESELKRQFTAGRYRAALPLAERLAIAVSRRFGPGHAKNAAPQSTLGQVHYSLGNYADSVRYYRNSLKLLRRRFGRNNLLTAQTMSNLALPLMKLQRLDDSRKLLDASHRIYRKLVKRNDPRLLQTIHTLGLVEYHKGNYEASNANYRRALTGYLRLYGQNSPRVVEMLAALATNMSALGQFDGAIALLERQIAILGKIYRPDHPAVGQALHDLAGNYMTQGLPRKALPLFEQALKIRITQLGASHIDVARSMTPLIAFYWDASLPEKAEQTYRQALSIFERSVGRDSPEVAGLMQNHGNGLVAHGRHEEAARMFTKALDIRRRFYGNRHIGLTSALNGLANVNSALGRTEEARELMHEALSIEKSALGPGSYEVAERLRNLGLLSNREGRTAEAYDYLRQAAALRRDQLSTVLASGRRDSQKASAKDRRPFLNAVQLGWKLAAAPQNAPPQRELIDQTLQLAQLHMQSTSDRALSQMAARFSTGRSELAAIVRKQQDLISKEERLRAHYTNLLGKPGGQTKEAQSAFDDAERLRQAIAKLRKTIARRYPRFAQLTASQPLSIAQVRSLLRPDEALIAFVTFKLEAYVWAVSHDGIAWQRIARSKKDLESEISALRKTLDPLAAQSQQGRGLAREQVCRGLERVNGSPAPCEAYDTDLGRAQSLHKLLLGPVETAISGKRHLIIVPSGPLTGLPFHMLVSKPPKAGGNLATRYKDAHWLLRDHSVTILPAVSSLRALRQLARSGRTKRPFIGIGNPSFVKPQQTPARTTRAKTRAVSTYFRGRLADIDRLSGKIPPLPDTAGELVTVGKALKARQRDIILGRKASETTLKSMSAKGRLDDYRIVHFATHGLVAGEIKGLAEPALALSLPSKATEKDDGLLTATEVAQLKLNAEWVVLSACNTAAGDKPGAEALSGLARAFFYSGARSLLVSHWPVVSEAAVLLTTRTFAALKTNPGIGRAEALRRSMLALIDGGKPYQRHPSYWAPFIIVGEGGTSTR